MRKGDLLFVYGTLRVGQPADLSRTCEYLGEDFINGRIYNLGWYPGLKTSPGVFDPGVDFVKGDVFIIPDDLTSVKLDNYEGYPDLYDRIETKTANGRRVWVYVYNYEVNDSSLVVGGDWVKRIQINPKMEN